jgi:hypothetical protein
MHLLNPLLLALQTMFGALYIIITEGDTVACCTVCMVTLNFYIAIISHQILLLRGLAYANLISGFYWVHTSVTIADNSAATSSTAGKSHFLTSELLCDNLMSQPEVLILHRCQVTGYLWREGDSTRKLYEIDFDFLGRHTYQVQVLFHVVVFTFSSENAEILMDCETIVRVWKYRHQVSA